VKHIKTFPYKKFLIIGIPIFCILILILIIVPINLIDYVLLVICFMLGILLTVDILKTKGYLEVKK